MSVGGAPAKSLQEIIQERRAIEEARRGRRRESCAPAAASSSSAAPGSLAGPSSYAHEQAILSNLFRGDPTTLGGGPRRLDNQPVPSRYYEAYASPGHGVFMDSSREGGRSSGAGEGSGGWWGQEIPTGQDHWVVDPGLEAAMADIGLDPDGSPTYEQLLLLEEYLGPQVPQKGLSEEEIANCSTPFVVDEDMALAVDSCSVCLFPFEAGDRGRTLSCSHMYHEECIDRWLSEHSSCPVCKVVLK